VLTRSFTEADQQVAATLGEREEKGTAFDLENTLVGTALRAFAHPTLAASNSSPELGEPL
jgi:hypothetical protein